MYCLIYTVTLIKREKSHVRLVSTVNLPCTIATSINENTGNHLVIIFFRDTQLNVILLKLRVYVSLQRRCGFLLAFL